MFGNVPASNTPGPPNLNRTSSAKGEANCPSCFTETCSSIADDCGSKHGRSSLEREESQRSRRSNHSSTIEDSFRIGRSKEESCSFGEDCRSMVAEDKPRSWRLKENRVGMAQEVSIEDKSKPRRIKESSENSTNDEKVGKVWRITKDGGSLSSDSFDSERSRNRRVSKESADVDGADVCGNSQTFCEIDKCGRNETMVASSAKCSGKYSTKETSSLNSKTQTVSGIKTNAMRSSNCLNFAKSSSSSTNSTKSQRISSSVNANPDSTCSKESLKLGKRTLSSKDHGKCSRNLTQTVQPLLSLCKSSQIKSGESFLGKIRTSDDLVDSSIDCSAISILQDNETCSQKSIDDGKDALIDPMADCDRDGRTDFVSSTPSKDWMKNSGDALQQSCVSCLPQDLPTEIQMSSPRSYKDREKSRDPWRPTEMESNICNLNVCPGDVYQDTGTKRRTGASCQALRHAVASLNRLDDFYMEKIGAGFFSEVYKVTHKVTNQVMVLKMNQLPANRPNMLKEVQLMNKLSHPNILRFMGVCVHEGQLHALTEYINGGSLEQLILSRHTPLPHLIRMNLARDVARGMTYLHSRGLFHRDLTSKNVLIKKDESTSEMTAVVGDFGLAAKIPDPSSGYRLSTVGSPYWISPECLKGQWYDHRSDVFSFGIVVCELIGRVPADPDVLPRSDNFGLDYLAVAEICAAADPPPAFLQLAFHCCTYEPKSRPSFPEITARLDTMIGNYEEESKNSACKRQSVDPALMSSMDEITREGRPMKRKTARLRSQSADARGCDNATPSEKARCHSARRVAELASRRDPHYRPMTANPFHALGGVKKILGDLFSSCLELPSLEDVRPSVTDAMGKFKPAPNDSIAKILDRKKPNSEPSSPTARKKWERKVATKVGAASLFAHPLFRDGWEPRRRGSCESGFWSCVGEDLSPEPPNRRHTSTLSSSAASSLFLLDDHRTSSIYTDSSEDIASLGGGDSCWEDRLGGIGSSSKTISKIVEYFERKQAGSLRLADHDTGSNRLTLLKASLEGPVPLCSMSAAQRLVVCEGAVRSKLPLFDKK